MQSRDLIEAHKIFKQIQIMSHFLENDKLKTSDPFKLSYINRTFNKKQVMEQFGVDESGLTEIAQVLDESFRKITYTLRERKIKELEELGIEFNPINAAAGDTP